MCVCLPLTTCATPYIHVTVQGIEESWRRHKEVAQYLWNAVEALGLELFIKNDVRGSCGAMTTAAKPAASLAQCSVGSEVLDFATQMHLDTQRVRSSSGGHFVPSCCVSAEREAGT